MRVGGWGEGGLLAVVVVQMVEVEFFGGGGDGEGGGKGGGGGGGGAAVEVRMLREDLIGADVVMVVELAVVEVGD